MLLQDSQNVDAVPTRTVDVVAMTVVQYSLYITSSGRDRILKNKIGIVMECRKNIDSEMG
jgi:hypothetical protein